MVPAATSRSETTSFWRNTVRRRLLAWYRRNARDLSWRRTANPYAIWVSEIMLQQTQVATVERYFAKFLAAFPTVAALAAAREDHVLRLWEGLGYYRRARQMHAAAQVIMDRHAGVFPRSLAELRELPGIGRYTAGAILSIAFDVPAPILEANTIRLLCRLLAFRGDPTSSVGQQLLWQTAEDLLPRRGSGQFNQALMELGSLVCTPRDPNCTACPLRELCPTQRDGWQQKIPAPQRQPAATDVREVAVIVFQRDKVLLRKCGLSERWAGLWDFPRFVLESPQTKSRGSKSHVPASQQRQITDILKQMTGISGLKPQPFVTLRHTVTRFRITLDCFTAECRATNQSLNLPQSTGDNNQWRWVKLSALDDYPLSTTGRKLAKLWIKQQAESNPKIKATRRRQTSIA